MGIIQDVKYVVLLMMENCVFDSYFGMFKGVCGYGDCFVVLLLNGCDVFYQVYMKVMFVVIVMLYYFDVCQGNVQCVGGMLYMWVDVQVVWDYGWMNCWFDVKMLLLMGYYDVVEVLFQCVFVDVFMLCDYYYCGMYMGMIVNCLFYWSGINGLNGISLVDGNCVKIVVLNNQFNGGNDIGLLSQGWIWMIYVDWL